jgi:hypothetical protein
MASGDWHHDFWATAAQLAPVLVAAHIVAMAEAARAKVGLLERRRTRS